MIVPFWTSVKAWISNETDININFKIQAFDHKWLISDLTAL